MSKKNKKSPRTPRTGPGHPGAAPGATHPGGGRTARPGAVGPARHPRPSVGQVRDDLQASGQQEGSPGMLVAALLGTTAFMFFYLHLLVLPQMSQLTGGLAMPDQQFLYGAAQLSALDAAMDEAAHGQLNWVHKTAGVIFPITVALSVSAVAAWCLPRSWGRWASYAAGVAFAVVDIVENVLIESALHAGGAGADTAAAFTAVRWVLLVALTAWVVLLLAGRIRRSVRERVAAVRGSLPR